MCLHARVQQFLSAGRVSGIGQKRILPTKPKISRLITRRLIECRSFRALSARCFFSRSCRRRRSSASSAPPSASWPPRLASLHFTSSHLISSHTDNFSLLGFPAVATPSFPSSLSHSYPTGFSLFIASNLLRQPQRCPYVNILLPPPLLILPLLPRFLLHLLLVSFIFMQW